MSLKIGSKAQKGAKKYPKGKQGTLNSHAYLSCPEETDSVVKVLMYSF